MPSDTPATTKGSCLCGAIRFEYTGETYENAICHCRDCQKWTGSSYSPCATVPRENFKIITGQAKTYDVTGGSGKINRYFFCGECGSSLWNEPEATPQWVCIRSGTLDGGAADLGGQIHVEFYTKDRVKYLCAVEGAKQEEKM